MSSLLSDREVERALEELPAWSRSGDALTRTIETPTFLSLLGLVHEIGLAAEKRQHHPDMSIRWRTLELSLRTHDAGGVTGDDRDLAQVIDSVVTRWTSGPSR